jgi:hypothetical protein
VIHLYHNKKVKRRKMHCGTDHKDLHSRQDVGALFCGQREDTEVIQTKDLEWPGFSMGINFIGLSRLYYYF